MKFPHFYKKNFIVEFKRIKNKVRNEIKYIFNIESSIVLRCGFFGDKKVYLLWIK